MLEQTPSEIVQWRIKVFKEHNRSVALRTLVSEAYGFVKLGQYHPLTCTWAREWLKLARKLLDEEAPQ